MRYLAETEGRALEEELNKKGPGEAFFVRCDMSKEEDIKVTIIIQMLLQRFWFCKIMKENLSVNVCIRIFVR